jgi:hypothetical protein
MIANIFWPDVHYIVNVENAKLFCAIFFGVLVYGGIAALLILGLIRAVKFLDSVPKEQKLLRMELGKLAEEVHQIRQELKTKE